MRGWPAGLLVALCACAEVAPPPGGPVDEVPPEVLAYSPAQGATGVDPSTTLEIEFSERVQRAEEAIEVLPDPGELRVEERGKKVRIKADLVADRTYEVTISERLSDAHGVNLAAPLHWAFSTGERIEGGELRGRVVAGIGDATEVMEALVLLMPPEALETEPLHWIRPEYHLSTASDGSWAIHHLPAGEWRALAVRDENNNGRIEPGKEQHGAYWRSIGTNDTTEVLLVLTPATPRPAEIIDARTKHKNLIELRVDRELPADARLTATLSGGATPRELIPAGDQVFVICDSLGPGLQTLRLEGLPEGEPARLETPQIELEGTNKADTQPPGLYATTLDSTRGLAPLDGRIDLIFDEPVTDSGAEAGALLVLIPGDSLQAPVAAQALQQLSAARWRVYFALPDSAELAGAIVPGPALVDRSGNPAQFSLHCRLPALAAALPLQGRVVNAPDLAGDLWVRVGEGGRCLARTRCDGQGRFSFPLLPAGELSVAAFVDLDGDRKWDAANARSGFGGEPVVVTKVQLSAEDEPADLRLEF